MSWWSAPTQDEAPPLAEGALHLWLIDLSQAQAHHQANLHSLNTQERARAARFVADPPRHQFAHARARMRAILGHYLERPPSDIQFTTEHRGKPRLAEREARLRFNLSHSHMGAVMAVTLSADLGVDIEHHDPRRDLHALAGYAFADWEREAFDASDDPVATFFQTWTLKEAYLKALGQGLAIDLKSFEVDAHATDCARLRRAQHPGAQPQRWWVQGLKLSPTYSVALAHDLPQAPHVVLLDATSL